VIALTGLTVRTEPKRSVGIVSQRLAMERPAINAQEAPFFEEGIAPAQTLVVGRRWLEPVLYSFRWPRLSHPSEPSDPAHQWQRCLLRLA
jgi:hypothetical protein